MMQAGLLLALDPSSTLMLYSGAWQVTRMGGTKPDSMVNQCTRTGGFVTCAQSVNGAPASLLVLIPREGKPNRFYTQNIRPEGRATSRGDLTIEGNVWTFSNTWNDVGKTTYYKTVNTFVTRSHIHYEQSESANNKDWKVTNSGDEVRTAGKH